jgi:hypothetical protein
MSCRVVSGCALAAAPGNLIKSGSVQFLTDASAASLHYSTAAAEKNIYFIRSFPWRLTFLTNDRELPQSSYVQRQ